MQSFLTRRVVMNRIIRKSLRQSTKNTLNTDQVQINISKNQYNNADHLEQVKRKIESIKESNNQNTVQIQLTKLSNPNREIHSFSNLKAKGSVRKCMRVLEKIKGKNISDAIEIAKNDLTNQGPVIKNMLQQIKLRSLTKHEKRVESVQIRYVMASKIRFTPKIRQRAKGRADMNKTDKVSKIRIEYYFKTDHELIEAELNGKFPKSYAEEIKSNLEEMRAPLDLIQSLNGILSEEGRLQNREVWQKILQKTKDLVRDKENLHLTQYQCQTKLIDQMLETWRYNWKNYYDAYDNQIIQKRKGYQNKKIMLE